MYVSSFGQQKVHLFVLRWNNLDYSGNYGTTEAYMVENRPNNARSYKGDKLNSSNNKKKSDFVILIDTLSRAKNKLQLFFEKSLK